MSATTVIQTTEPWWKNGHVWLIIAGPLSVVIAGFATLYLAIRTPDPVVATDYYRRGVEINRTLAGSGTAATPGQTQGHKPMVAPTLAPAQMARNHAATGAVPAPPPQATDKP